MKTDINIVHISQAAKLYPRPEYIFVMGDVDARVAIKNLPTAKTLNIARGYAEHEYNVFMSHLTDLQDVYESLIDEESKKTFCGYWLGKISNQISNILYSNSAHYLISGFIPRDGAITFDAGVFDGGTSAVFSEMGYKVYAFEMDKVSFERSKKLAEEKNFVLENLALGSRKCEVPYNANGGYGNHADARGADLAKVINLDAYVRENHLPSVDFIKLDVEGAELDILRGARTSIARYKPILAISAYHKLEDFWTLMNFVKSIRPDYEFALRQFAETREEAPAIFEDNSDQLYVSLGIEPDKRNFSECVLFAR